LHKKVLPNDLISSHLFGNPEFKTISSDFQALLRPKLDSNLHDQLMQTSDILGENPKFCGEIGITDRENAQITL
jgi:hypothetical protein